NKWDPTFLSFQINSIFDSIEKGIKAKKSLILFPESALPLHLNREPLLEEKLLDYSQKITIIVGALSGEKNGVYNSTFLFQKGKKDVAHKVILVPFGEEVPLPEFFEKLINKFFYAGASDFLTARMPQDFIINGEKVRNAICFEATKPELFEKTPGIMVALSNNAWFTPSTQPFLQKRLLRLYATLYKTTIYHSANSADGGIFPPESAIFNLPWQNDLF
ncbi:MAG: apolipoprotein N-acyltransferase, partial [Campylobacteraceae bacterium]|nr:apolipoprotein N-acyltransferase [Campylobacteraceae bacterium]